jgi:beta-alanine degradation protein BauB
MLKKSIITSLLVANLLISHGVASAQNVAKPLVPNTATGFGTANLAFESMQFSGSPGTMRGPRLAGPHGFMVRLPAKWESNFHIHPANYHAVVIQGTAVNNYLGQSQEVRLIRGGYFATQAGVNHTTRCLSDEDCIFYVQMDGPFGALAPYAPPGQPKPASEPANIR